MIRLYTSVLIHRGTSLSDWCCLLLQQLLFSQSSSPSINGLHYSFSSMMHPACCTAYFKTETHLKWKNGVRSARRSAGQSSGQQVGSVTSGLLTGLRKKNVAAADDDDDDDDLQLQTSLRATAGWFFTHCEAVYFNSTRYYYPYNYQQQQKCSKYFIWCCREFNVKLTDMRELLFFSRLLYA